MNQKMSQKLQMVRKIEENKIKNISEDTRPIYHVSSPVGWMNDPNGFSIYKDEYHLFFQYHPFSTAWGPMHWGHYKSKDFIRWEQLPIAMAPDENYDNGGCYSGSAIEVNGEHILIYTGVIDHYLDDGSHDYRQIQCLAKGDGKDYIKYRHNPIISGEQLPEGGNIKDFRDPKIWKEDDGYYLVVGNRAIDGYGQILLYRSANLKDWKFITVLDSSQGEYGKMWECPDFFALDEKQILLISPQDMRAQGYEFHNGNNSIFLYGTYDKENHIFKREKVTAIDYGLDFYAPQTLLSKDGRRIMIAWMQSWDAHITSESHDWSGMMTIPRELTIKNGRIYQTPVRELSYYYQNKIIYRQQTIKEMIDFKGISGRSLDLEIEILDFNFEHFAVHFACNEQYDMELIYNHKRNCLTIDRTHSGLVRDVVCRRKMKINKMEMNSNEEVLKLRLLIDYYSVEVFVNDGEKVMSAIFFTPLEADGILFDTDGSATINVTKYDIRV
ncbi:MAG: glycoside hydrolase family 32 protein [Lachnospiraceae bacterium]|nr:glycoside hydrolase family 32 protein [Lachnospiraceae bacterium]